MNKIKKKEENLTWKAYIRMIYAFFGGQNETFAGVCALLFFDGNVGHVSHP